MKLANLKKILNKFKLPFIKKSQYRSLPENYISPQSIIEKHSIQELNEKAEGYFQNITDFYPFISRPFANFDKSPDSLIALGTLLSGLQLGKTMKVLELGAGVCWLSRLLNQMGASTISVDCSPSAIATGKKLFKDYPIIGNYIEEPQFQTYNGHYLDIKDTSVDRVVCFDAFHHIANTEEILGEIFRVLKDGGIAGFAEPGLYHSADGQSQSEMRNYGVLENDICLTDIKKIAEKIGFNDIYIQLATNTRISLNEYQQMVDYGRINKRIKNTIHNDNQNKTIFFLQKGKFILDSRNGDGLQANIQLENLATKLEAKTEAKIELPVNIENIGQAKWLYQNINDLGVVKIAGHLFDQNKQLIEHDFFRIRLEKDISPGETYSKNISFIAPTAPGEYLIGIDLLAEHICWFENCGSQVEFIKVLVT